MGSFCAKVRVWNPSSPEKVEELEAMVEKFEKQEYERIPQLHGQTSFTAFRQARAEIREQWITRVMSEEYRKAEPEKMRELLSQLWGVVCLTEVPDNVLMWTRYADSYQGFVAEFICDWEHYGRRNKKAFNEQSDCRQRAKKGIAIGKGN